MPIPLVIHPPMLISPKHDELILFQYPNHTTTLIVFNLTADTSEHELIRIFGEYGLIHSVVLRSKTELVHSDNQSNNNTQSARKPKLDNTGTSIINSSGRSQSDSTSLAALMHSDDTVTNNDSNDNYIFSNTDNINNQQTKTTYFAFVRYYSIDQSRRARTSLHNGVLHNRRIHVIYQQPLNKEMKSYALKHYQSIELMNYFIGFNGYSIAIVRCERYNTSAHQSYNIDLKHEQTIQNIDRYKTVYIAEIAITFSTQYCMMGESGNTVHAIGISFCCDNESNAVAVKRAVTNAHNEIFNDIGIIRLLSGKTCICSIRNKKAL